MYSSSTGFIPCTNLVGFRVVRLLTHGYLLRGLLLKGRAERAMLPDVYQQVAPTCAEVPAFAGD